VTRLLDRRQAVRPKQPSPYDVLLQIAVTSESLAAGLRLTSATLSLRMAVYQSRGDLRRTLEAARPEMEDIHYAAELQLTYAALFHREKDVLLVCKYFLATDRIDLVLAVLEGWERNPYRTA
jgi:hypothetical protein